jgi:hypothetical protein
MSTPALDLDRCYLQLRMAHADNLAGLEQAAACHLRAARLLLARAQHRT